MVTYVLFDYKKERKKERRKNKEKMQRDLFLATFCVMKIGC